MHRLVIFIMGGVIVALAFAVISLSTVAVMAQTMALLSQCVLALGMIGVGFIVIGGITLRNRVIQIYLARRLLGAETDRVLVEQQRDQVKALPEMFSQNHRLLPAESASAQSTLVQTPPRSASLALPVLPVMPRGWGFDEED